MEDWECQSCTALNQSAHQECWKCSNSKASSATTLAIRQGVAAEEISKREALQAGHQRSRQALLDANSDLRESGRLEFRAILLGYVGSNVGMNVKDPVKLVEVDLAECRPTTLPSRQVT